MKTGDVAARSTQRYLITTSLWSISTFRAPRTPRYGIRGLGTRRGSRGNSKERGEGVWMLVLGTGSGLDGVKAGGEHHRQRRPCLVRGGVDEHAAVQLQQKQRWRQRFVNVQKRNQVRANTEAERQRRTDGRTDVRPWRYVSVNCKWTIFATSKTPGVYHCTCEQQPNTPGIYPSLPQTTNNAPHP